MKTIVLEIHQDNKYNKVYLSIENITLITLINFLQYSPNIRLQFLRKTSYTQHHQHEQSKLFCLKSKLSTFNRNSLRRNKSANSLRLPIFINNDLYTSGFCAVARNIIKNSKYANRQDLLGFKGGCLQAPTEASLWTRFCEIEIISTVNNILKHEFKENEVFTLPSSFAKFEAHLAQPIRMHNIFKIAKHKDNTASLHKFAEGIYFSLADIILYISFYFILENLPNSNKLNEKFPLLFKWLNEIETNYSLLNKIVNEINSLCLKKNTIQATTNHIKFFVNEEKQQSLYKSDPKRYKPKSRIFTTQNHIIDNIEKFKLLNISNSKHEIVTIKNFEWNQISSIDVHLESGNIPNNRLIRKKQQIKSMVDIIISIAKDNDVIVDFCSGTGHLGIILAYLLPKCTIIFLENKPFSIEQTQKRVIETLKLTNCLFYQSNIDYFNGKFNIGTSLHACGTATDIVLNKCIYQKASFVCCPCCYGSISPMPHIMYPRSKAYQSSLTEIDYLYLAHAADQTQIIENYNFNFDKNFQGEYCMDVIDTDRKLLAIEFNYNVILTTLKPENCTLKNRLLIGSIENIDGINIINK